MRRIYGAVQTAKRQGLHGGHFADYVERHLGRRLVGNEYTIAAKAKEHLGYSPPGGYGGPSPRGSAKVPTVRASAGDPKLREARGLISAANTVIRNIARSGIVSAMDRTLVNDAAADLDVAADLYEEAGARITAGTVREHARRVRLGTLQPVDV